MRRFDKAIGDFNAAIRLNPKFAQAYYCRGVAYDEKGEKAKAEEDFVRAEKLGQQGKLTFIAASRSVPASPLQTASFAVGNALG